MPLPCWTSLWNCGQRYRMASFAPLHTGQFIIKPRTLRRQRWVAAAMVVTAVFVPYIAYELGRARGGYSVVASQREHWAQASRINALENELAGVRRELSSVQIDRKVDQQSTDSMHQSFADLQSTIRKQQEELAFYKAIVSPAADTAIEPQVQRVEVQADAVANRYRLLLALIQPMQAKSNAQGTLQVRITGTRQEQPVSFDLQELLVDKSASALTFAYRYFQNFEQLIELPADFQPQTIHVEVQAAQHAPKRQEFAWQSRALVAK